MHSLSLKLRGMFCFAFLLRFRVRVVNIISFEKRQNVWYILVVANCKLP
ncbi:hypothetical protein GLYMA_02G287051v4 [Glycine max]|nr:hypothetical protein GLYMA_02G287051v4 [Glycine max]KAH1062608.1 hypothetical protein GYH30_005530 [Glycine max]